MCLCKGMQCVGNTLQKNQTTVPDIQGAMSCTGVLISQQQTQPPKPKPCKLLTVAQPMLLQMKAPYRTMGAECCSAWESQQGSSYAACIDQPCSSLDKAGKCCKRAVVSKQAQQTNSNQQVQSLPITSLHTRTPAASFAFEGTHLLA